MASVTFRGVTKQYQPDAPPAVDALDLTIEDGEFMVLVGPSGCGKSTALRMIAGLEEISGGDLSIGDRVVNEVPPGDRDIAMVFQNYALYPHMTVRDNIGFSLTVAKVAKAEVRRRSEEAAAMLGLTEYLDRLPKALSGGQRQRVAMGRAIVRSPQVFLMDEPLSNLDAKLRVQMRSEIIQLQRRLATTMVYVTHDQVEAMTMGTRVAVMRKGVLQQVAPAPGAVPAARQPVRRRVHRQPGHEPDHRHARRSPRSPDRFVRGHTLPSTGGPSSATQGSSTGWDSRWCWAFGPSTSRWRATSICRTISG